MGIRADPLVVAQDAEKGFQPRSHRKSILNVAQRLRLRLILACGLAGNPFEHPATRDGKLYPRDPINSIL
jgi:hypothetical protein